MLISVNNRNSEHRKKNYIIYNNLKEIKQYSLGS